MINLNEFCADKYEVRTYLQVPSSVGQFTVATNGHVLVRVPRRDDVEPVKDFPKLDSITKFADEEKEFIDIPAVDKPDETMIVCYACNGQSKYEDDDCFCYDGMRPPKPTYIDIGHQRFDQKYIYKLSQLPNAKIALNSDDQECAYIKFDGGDAFLMPIRK